MAYSSLRPEIPYLTWPDVNIFPMSVNGSEVNALKGFQFYIFVIIMPAISFLGILCHITSLHILCQQDLTKCSNFLVLCLTLADVAFLSGTNNIPIQLYDHDQNFGFRNSPAMAYFLYVAYHFQRALEFISKVLSLNLPCFITFERLMAVYFPLSFRRMLTPCRVRLAVTLLLMLATVAWVLTSLKFGYVYSVDPDTKEGAGFMVKSSFILNHLDFYNSCFKTILILYGPCSIVFTVTSCLLIGIKIQVQAKKRLHMMKVSTKVSRVKMTSKFLGFFKFGVLMDLILRKARPRHQTTKNGSEHIKTSSASLILSISYVRDPDGQSTQVKVTNGQYTQEQVTEGQCAQAQVTDGQCTKAQVTDGQYTKGQVDVQQDFVNVSANITKRGKLNAGLLGLRGVSWSEDVGKYHQSTYEKATTSRRIDEASSLCIREQASSLCIREEASNKLHDKADCFSHLICASKKRIINSDTMCRTRVPETTGTQNSDTADLACVPSTPRSPKSRSKTYINRTTRILLSVCIFYTFANAFNFVVLFFFSPSGLDLRRGLIVEVVRKLVLVINSASNFLIYVIFHRKFRDSYMNMFCRCPKRLRN